jgi:diguanylate cyclase (GGDEF)-like protein
MSEEKRLASEYIDRLNTLRKTGLLDDLDAMRTENRELETLINDAAALIALPAIEDMISFVTARLLDRFIPQGLLFLIEDPDGKGPRQYLFRNLKLDAAGLDLSFYEPMRDWFRENPHPIDFDEYTRKSGVDDFGPELARFSPRVVIPMLGIGGVHGLVLLGPRVIGDEYSGPELMYMNRLMRFLSIGIQNNLHHESSITDPKTGLYNNRYFVKRLDDELARVARHETEAGVIMIDVDHFKNFNDRWGHLAGDEVLVGIARAIKASIRAVDVASRFGGEEFCVLAIECKADKLAEIGERIRIAIEGLRVPFDANILRITASLGCCHIDGSLKLSGQGYIEKADKALYQSKSAGRNRSTVYRFGLFDRANARLRAAAPSSGGPTELLPVLQ